MNATPSAKAVADFRAALAEADKSKRVCCKCYNEQREHNPIFLIYQILMNRDFAHFHSEIEEKARNLAEEQSRTEPTAQEVFERLQRDRDQQPNNSTVAQNEPVKGSDQDVISKMFRIVEALPSKLELESGL